MHSNYNHALCIIRFSYKPSQSPTLPAILWQLFFCLYFSIYFVYFLFQANTPTRRLCVWSYLIPIVSWCTIRQNFDGQLSCPFIRVLLQELLLKYGLLLYPYIRDILSEMYCFIYELMWIIYNRRCRDVWFYCQKPVIWDFVTWELNPWYLWLPKDRLKTIKIPRTN